MSRVDLVIIGAGPAGLAAATEADDHGLEVVVLDEQWQPGGQIYRALESTPLQDRSVLGEDYWAGESLIRGFRDSGAEFRPGSTVWRIDRDGTVCYRQQDRVAQVQGRALLVASGAMERSVPFTGWQLPGVMTAGAGQILLKSAGISAQDVVLAGAGPLLSLLAWQYVRAGVRPAAVVDLTPRINYLRALRQLPSAVAGWRYLKKGLALQAEVRRAGVPWLDGCSQLAAEGCQRLQAVTFSHRGQTRRLDTEHLMTHFGVIPNTNLLASVGADLHWDDSQHCWRPVRADGFRTTVPGIYAVGDGQGIFGARSAALSGALAVRQCLREFHWLDSVDEARDRQLMRDYQDDARVRPFLETLFLPPFDQLLTLDDEVVVCRCEEVTVAELKQACEAGARGVNQLKTYTRCGMGPCQGRQCGNAVSLLQARWLGEPVSQVGYYHARSPVVPVTFGELGNIQGHRPSSNT
ncbi:NAD(P)/FAD-dependent oxidoreductase [Oceanimonas sp. MB9]|uniref:FAD/NAD(P)-dependent oxidoreductase n=1 Tax=Oceanimonas sp. MB9 TaxID=2588453 RepID=UPI0013F687E7|nr:NAD(P)/FAD-dependent oxidoreductase [Oceanimonas sp. MB9]NHI00415.1 Hydrogen cyanide synthase subunit HcnB [Oceanimonas sp. MB9]